MRFLAIVFIKWCDLINKPFNAWFDYCYKIEQEQKGK